MTGSIVCGVDGSRDARLALGVAAQLSRRLGLRLVLANVVHAQVFAGAGPTPLLTAPTGEELEVGELLLEQLAAEERLPDAGRRVVYGLPAERLAEVADEEDAELLVVGSRGRGGFRAAFLGSVSNDLIGIARCPVLVVPPGAQP